MVYEMELTYALCIYAFVVVILILIFCRTGIRAWSAVVLSLLIGQILINILAPPSDIDTDTDSGSSYAFYMLIQLGTPIVVFIYAFMCAFRDKHIEAPPPML